MLLWPKYLQLYVIMNPTKICATSEYCNADESLLFLQCCGCNAYHKLVDNLNLFHDMNCYVNSSFNYNGPNLDVNFNFLDSGDDEDDLFSP